MLRSQEDRKRKQTNAWRKWPTRDGLDNDGHEIGGCDTAANNRGLRSTGNKKKIKREMYIVYGTEKRVPHGQTNRTKGENRESYEGTLPSAEMAVYIADEI